MTAGIRGGPDGATPGAEVLIRPMGGPFRPRKALSVHVSPLGYGRAS